VLVGLFIGLVVLNAPVGLLNSGPGPVGAAEPWHVAPQIDINLRAGKGTEFKILAILSAGTPIELIGAEEDGWVRVRLADGTEGWMLKRYLGRGAPPLEAMADLQATTSKLEHEIEEQQEHLARLTANYQRSQAELKAAVKERAAIQVAYDNILKDAAEVINIKKRLGATTENLQELKQHLAVVEQENEDLRSNKNIWWFVAGGGIIFLGWLIGMLTGRNRRRGPSLL